MKGRGLILWTVAALWLIPALAEARITRIEITRVESPTFEGRSFGDVGQYDKLVGVAFGEVDPAHPLNAGIVNLDRAPRNARGMVEYDADVHILKPIDMRRGNRTLFYTVVNRGNAGLTFHIGAGGGNDATTAAHAGDGFMLERGYTLVKNGWQGDILPGSARMTARFPIATNPDGTPIRKVITAEFVRGTPTFTTPIGEANTAPYLPVEESMAGATLYRRAGPHAPRGVIPRDQWSFARCPDGVTMTPSQTDVCLPAGFSTNFIYELVYEMRDPIVMGLGFAATRDVISFLRYDRSAANPLVERNPGGRLKNPIRHALGFGSSQSGRYLKDLIYQGFNQDESGRIVFDGAVPHISGSRKTWTNFEFAFPGRFSRSPVENHYAPGDQFPFAYGMLTDPISGKTDGVLRRCRESGACPKLMHWDSSTEAWAARASLVVTDPLGMTDVSIPGDVRIYLFSSTQHGPAGTPSRGICQQLSNPNQYREIQRALLDGLHAWVTDDRKPPKSRVPRLHDGTLTPSLPQAAMGFPAIPDVRYTGGFNDLFINDVNAQPPVHIPGTEYTVLVPRVDEDGNDIGGVRSVTTQAPLGTYTGWNLRRAGFIEDESCGLTGSYIPFATTKAERLSAGDPRLSLEERYGTHAGYVKAVERAAKRLVHEGFLLEEDADRLIQEAQDRNLDLPPGRLRDRN